MNSFQPGAENAGISVVKKVRSTILPRHDREPHVDNYRL